jgi:hypothetical protein
MRLVSIKTYLLPSFFIAYFYIKHLIEDDSFERDILTEMNDERSAPCCRGSRCKNASAREIYLCSKIHEYKDLLATANKVIGDLQNEMESAIEKPRHEGSDATTNKTDLVPFKESTCICSLLPNSKPFTASNLWKRFLPEIIKASRNPDLPESQTKESEEKMDFLLNKILLPSRMRRAVRHIPTFHHDGIRHILDIVHRRMRDPEKFPPLSIAVFGGSVTIGRNCLGKPEFHNLSCAWPRRFELLVNQILGQDVVRVYNLGVGGTNSDTGTRMLKYWMYPEDLKEFGPDVIINSYSTNDSLPPWNATKDQDLVDLILDQSRDRLQNFVREALHSRPCGTPPLVVHVDDWLGPRQVVLLGELSYNTAMVQIAKWYDTFAVSYADVVRDLVYKNTSDPTFFKEWDAHYGPWAHQTIAWSLAFATVELLTNFCNDEFQSYPNRNCTSENEKAHLSKDQLLKYPTGQLPLLPPLLSRKLVLKNVTNEWMHSAKEHAEKNAKVDCSSNNHNPCLSAWIAAPENFGAYEINNFMSNYGTQIDGWEVEKDDQDGWSQKVGLVAKQKNASFTITFKDTDKPLKIITIFYLKSYGTKWVDSQARLTVSNSSSNLLHHDLSGEHNLKYSLTYSKRLELNEVIPIGSTINLTVGLKNGITFKIMGLMFCSN